MTNYSTFLNSTLGKKIQVAITGVLLCLFLLFHLMNNLILFGGPDLFNPMVENLESIKPIIRLMEVGLLIIFLIHIFNTIYLTIYNKKASPKKYSIISSETTSINSRIMIISGVVILLFLIIHLKYFWYTYQIHSFIPDETYYDVIMRTQAGYLGHTPTAIFYIIAILFISSHLKHGFQSALKTFGMLETSKWKFLNSLSIFFWGVIPGLFILIILSIQLNYIK